MFKLKTMLYVFVLSALFFSAGCADKGTLGLSTSVENDSDFNSEKTENSTSDTELELLSITTVRETFDEEAEKIKAREFDNISFENTYFSFPAADEFYTLEYNNLEN